MNGTLDWQALPFEIIRDPQIVRTFPAIQKGGFKHESSYPERCTLYPALLRPANAAVVSCIQGAIALTRCSPADFYTGSGRTAVERVQPASRHGG